MLNKLKSTIKHLRGKNIINEPKKLSDFIKIKYSFYISKSGFIYRIKKFFLKLPDFFVYLPILILGIFTLYMTHYKYIPCIPEAWVTHFEKVIINIHVGLGALIIALVIFIVNCIKESTDSDAGYIYLKISQIKILLLVQLLGYSSVVVNAAIGVQVVLAFISGCLILYSFLKTIQLHIEKDLFNNKLIERYKKRINNHIQDSIIERIANSYLYSIDKTIGIVKFKFYPDFRINLDYRYYSVIGEGVLGDINFQLLYDLSKVIQNNLKNKNINLYHDEKSNPQTIQQHDESIEIDIIKCYNDTINTENRNVIRIKKSDRGKLEDNVDREIEIKLNKAFIITDDNNISKILGHLFQEKEDCFIEALNNNNLGEIEKLKEFYLSVIDNFIDKIAEIGGYDYLSAKNEVNNIFNKWSVIKWLDDSLQRFFKLTHRTHDLIMFKKIILMPLHFAIKGLRKNDHFIFQSFIQYSIYPYLIYTNEAEIRFQQDQIIEIRRYTRSALREIITYNILPIIKNYQTDPEEIKQKVNYIWPVYKCYERLLRETYRRNEYEYFVEVLNDLNEIFKYIEIRDPEIVYSEINFYHNAKLTNLEKEIKNVLRERILILYRIASWIFKQINKFQNKYIEKIMEYLPRDIYNILYLYMYSHIQDVWGWEYDDLSYDGHVYTADSGDYIDRFYVLYILVYLKQINIDDAKIKALLKIKKEDVYRPLKIGQLANEILPRIVDSLVISEFFMSYSAEHTETKITIDKFKELLKRIHELHIEKTKEKIRKETLSPDKIKAFIKEVLEAYNQYSEFIQIYKYNNQYIDKSDDISEVGNGNPVGINQLFSKEVFIEDEPAIISGLSRFGERSASYVNDEIIKKIYKYLNEHDDKGDAYDFEKLMKKYEIKNPMIIVADTSYYEIETKIKQYKGEYTYTIDNNNPLFNHPFNMVAVKCNDSIIPIFRIHVNETLLTKILYFVDYTTLGTFIQLPPTKDKNRMKYKHGVLQIRITDLNIDEDWRKSLASNPDFLSESKDPGDKENILKENVIIEIYHNFEMKMPAKINGCKIRIIEGHNEH